MKRIFNVTVDGRSRGKRQQLSGGVDIALCANGERITDGTYQVTIERCSKKCAYCGEMFVDRADLESHQMDGEGCPKDKHDGV